ncbi:hypothetical protein [Lentzea sp. NPDC092896]|uniref:hypothetical protein n=1 Tax=Lentzea sp. NPDC092896 TaxID=3364127 RepID=UPI00380B8AAA
MGRPKWKPETIAQQHAIKEAKAAADHADNADNLMWQKVQTALDAGVPAAYMAETVRRGRATLYRHTTPPGNTHAAETNEEN